ncbi:MAG: hypothetical protein J6S67_00280 [Methanobrevibacter sp.]|nr:hypothetical protein [Methanobrevibacter sp.]
MTEIWFKTILCLVLIANGVVGLVSYMRQRKVEKRKIVVQVVANHIIAKDAIWRSDLPLEDKNDAINHLTGNTIDIVLTACGTGYVEYAYRLLGEYENNKRKIENEQQR